MSSAAPQTVILSPRTLNWIEAHLARLERAIAFLRARGILCAKVDRESEVARFRVTGRQNALFGHDVIEMAEDMGFAG